MAKIDKMNNLTCAFVVKLYSCVERGRDISVRPVVDVIKLFLKEI